MSKFANLSSYYFALTYLVYLYFNLSSYYFALLSLPVFQFEFILFCTIESTWHTIWVHTILHYWVYLYFNLSSYYFALLSLPVFQFEFKLFCTIESTCTSPTIHGNLSCGHQGRYKHLGIIGQNKFAESFSRN